MRADGGEKRDEWRLNSSFEHLGVTVQLKYAQILCKMIASKKPDKGGKQVQG